MKKSKNSRVKRICKFFPICIFLVLILTSRIVDSCSNRKSEIHRISLNQEKDSYFFNVSYPEFPEENEDIKNQNRRIKNWALEEIDAFLEEDAMWCSQGIDSDEYPHFLTIDYDVFSAGKDLLSIRFYIEIYFGIGMPSRSFYCINYDLKNKKEIDFKQFILGKYKTKQQSLKILKKETEKYLSEKRQYCKHFSDDDYNLKVFENFNLSEKGMYFIFDRYVIDCYKNCGFPEVFIPFSKPKKTNIVQKK